MQNDFIDGSLGTSEAASIVGAAAEKIRGFDGDIVYTMDTHDADYLNTAEGKKLPVKHCIKGTEGWQLSFEIESALRERGAYEKRYMKSTFGSTLLAEDLVKEYALEEIVIIGLCTDICVISNALLLKAFMPEVRIAVDAQCCAGVTPQSHENALAAMEKCQIDVI
jgi:nicotinamidase-related amidase